MSKFQCVPSDKLVQYGIKPFKVTTPTFEKIKDELTKQWKKGDVTVWLFKHAVDGDSTATWSVKLTQDEAVVRGFIKSTKIEYSFIGSVRRWLDPIVVYFSRMF